MTCHGWMVQCERPVWEPLIELVGLNVVGCFMWMHEIELEDGLEIHAYKSIATRQYLYLSVNGRAFAYVARRRYEEIALPEALEETFAGWEQTLPAPPDPEAVRVLLARHRPVRSQEMHQ